MSISTGKIIQPLPRLRTWLAAIVTSKHFFAATVGLFVLESVWIAISVRFPAAYDEGTHLGVIQIYSHQLSPFITHQPPGSEQLGELTRNPSYLYHYMMSFPWRLISGLTDNFMAQVILMRTINIGLLATGIVLWRKVFRKTKVPEVLINLVFLFFVLTPLVPQVAAQINYDNLVLPLMATGFILVLNFAKSLRLGKFSWSQIIALVCLALVAGITKYAVLPVFVAVGAYLGWQFARAWRKDKALFKKTAANDYAGLSLAKKIALVLAIVVSLALFVERYGVNVVQYGNPSSSCYKVLSLPDCLKAPAYKRNYDYARTRDQSTIVGPVPFTYHWLRHMGYNLMFALNGPESGYVVGRPLPLPEIATGVLGVGGTVLVLLFRRKVFATSEVRLFGLVIATYCTALWILNYSEYVRFGQLTAVQGRYLLPVLIFIYLIIGLAVGQAFKWFPKSILVLSCAAVICFMAGGGALTFILHSDSSWYWPKRSVITLNQKAQQLLRPIIPGSRYIPHSE